MKKSGKVKHLDNDITCVMAMPDGTFCPWSTSESIQQGGTSNLISHLSTHGIIPPKSEARNSMMSYLKRADEPAISDILGMAILLWHDLNTFNDHLY